MSGSGARRACSEPSERGRFASPQKGVMWRLLKRLLRMALSARRTGISARTWWAAVAIAAGFVLGAAAALSAEEVGVDAERQGSALAISAHATIRAPLPLIWRTLTDYDHLAEFIPGMRRSRVVARRGSTAIVEQTGEARFFIFHYPIAVVVESDEHYPATIGVRVLAGNLKQLAGAYRIETVPGARDEFVLRWRGIIEPDIFLPLFITAPGLRETVADQFLGMVKEIERRRNGARE
jgi:polyketide cyclase/dehydrase/lipid transport protein